MVILGLSLIHNTAYIFLDMLYHSVRFPRLLHFDGAPVSTADKVAAGEFFGESAVVCFYMEDAWCIHTHLHVINTYKPLFIRPTVQLQNVTDLRVI